MVINSFKQLTGKEIAIGIGFAVIFLSASFGSEYFAQILANHVDVGGLSAALVYMATVIAVVLIPLASSLPFVPIATVIWGPVLAALMTLAAWIISAFIAFSIARRFSTTLERRFSALHKVRTFTARIPAGNQLFAILFLSMLGSGVDIISYAAGLFTRIKMKFFLPTVMLGLAVFSFFLNYTATLPIVYQTYIIGGMVLVWFIVLGWLKQSSNGGESPTNHTTDR